MTLAVGVNVSVDAWMSARWWTGDLSNVYPASHPMSTEIRSTPTPQLPISTSSFRKWMDGWASPSLKKQSCCGQGQQSTPTITHHLCSRFISHQSQSTQDLLTYEISRFLILCICSSQTVLISFPQITSYVSLHIIIFHSANEPWSALLFLTLFSLFVFLPWFLFPCFDFLLFCPLFVYVLCGMSLSLPNDPCPILFPKSPSVFCLSDTRGCFSQSVCQSLFILSSPHVHFSFFSHHLLCPSIFFLACFLPLFTFLFNPLPCFPSLPLLL